MQDALSTRYAASEYRAGDDLVHWTNTRIRGLCDECLAIRYETNDLATAPGYPRTLRRVRDTKLYLCHPHAAAWKDRDRDE